MVVVAALLSALVSLAPAAGMAMAGDLSGAVGRAVAGTLSEDQEQALFGELGEVSVQVADRYDQWVKTGSDESRRAALATGDSILPLLERLRGYHQGRIDKAQADIIREDGNPETLYTQRWWQLDRGFALAAAGQLSWLHYRMAMLSPDKKAQRDEWLRKSEREFSEFIAASDEKMRLESLLGRAMAASALGRRDDAEGDLKLVLEQAKGTSLYWPARMALAEVRAGAGGAAALSETQKLLGEAQSAGLGSDSIKQIRMLRLDALLASMAASGGGGPHQKEAASLAAQLSALGPAYAQRVTQMAVARLRDPRPVLGATVSAEWIAAENLAAVEKFEEAAKAYEKIGRSTDEAARVHAEDVLHRLGVCYFRLGRYADAERELRSYLSKAPDGVLAPEAAYLQFRAAEGVFRASPSAETRNSFMAVAENFTTKYPDHESRYEGLFRYAELLQGEHRYAEAAQAYAQVEGPPAFRLRAAAAELQCLADTLSTTGDLSGDAATDLRSRAEAAWQRLDKLAAGASATASADLRARATVARAMVVGSGAGADSAAALGYLEDFEKRFPDQNDLVLATTSLRLAAAVSLSLLDQAQASANAMAAMPGTEANYNDLIERLSRALLRRSADVAPTDPEASRRWAAMATTLLDRLLAAGRPIPPEVRLNLAQSYVEQNRLSDAATLYGQLLVARPESRSLLRAAALVADRRGQGAESADYWSRLALLQQVATPAWYEARLATAAALATAGKREEACTSVREVEGFRPDLRDGETKKRFADLQAQVCVGIPG